MPSPGWLPLFTSNSYWTNHICVIQKLSIHSSINKPLSWRIRIRFFCSCQLATSVTIDCLFTIKSHLPKPVFCLYLLIYPWECRYLNLRWYLMSGNCDRCLPMIACLISWCHEWFQLTRWYQTQIRKQYTRGRCITDREKYGASDVARDDHGAGRCAQLFFSVDC